MTKSADILNFITKASAETVPTLPGILNNSGSPELGWEVSQTHVLTVKDSKDS